MPTYKVYQKSTGKTYTVNAKTDKTPEELKTIISSQGQIESPERKSLYAGLGAELTPAMEEARPFLGATEKILKEGFTTPLLHYTNQALLNQPRGIVEKLGYEYPEAETLPGQILSKGAGIAGAITSPITRGIMGLAKGGGLIKQALTGAAKGAAIGGLYSPKDITDVKTRGQQATFGAILGGLTGVGSYTFGKVSKYPVNKTTDIANASKKYHRQETSAYGQAIKQLEKETGIIDSTPLEKMTEMMVNRGLYDRVNDKWITPLNKVDRELVNSYEQLLRIYKKNGNVKVGDVIKVYQKLRDAGGSVSEPNSMTRNAMNTADELFDSIKDKIKSDTLGKANIRYRQFKNNMEIVDDKFKIYDLWGNPLKTEEGERFIKSGLLKSSESKQVANVAKKQLGVGLTGGKILSGITQIAANPLARSALVGGGIGLGILGANRNKR